MSIFDEQVTPIFCRHLELSLRPTLCSSGIGFPFFGCQSVDCSSVEVWRGIERDQNEVACSSRDDTFRGKSEQCIRQQRRSGPIGSAQECERGTQWGWNFRESRIIAEGDSYIDASFTDMSTWRWRREYTNKALHFWSSLYDSLLSTRDDVPNYIHANASIFLDEFQVHLCNIVYKSFLSVSQMNFQARRRKINEIAHCPYSDSIADYL